MGLLSGFLDNYKTGLGVIGDALSGNKKKKTSTSSKKNTTSPITLVNPNPLAATSPLTNVNVKPTVTTNTQNASYYKTPATNTNKQNASYYEIPATNTPSTSVTTNVTPSVSVPGVGGTSTSVSGTTAENPYKLDLSDILAAYTKSAEAQKKSISDATAAQRKMLEDTLASRIKSLQTSESTQRENLLTSLKRFQEDTAQSRKQQQSSFNASRADLEAQAFMANRAAMQSAAARGLGGSGLQQLAQIQNMINQSGEINELAIANTDALNALAQAYARQEQDTNTNISNLARDTQNQIDSLTTEQKNTLSSLISQEANSLNEIETNTTSLKEQLKYQEAVRAENARVQAEQFAANLQAQNAQIAANYDLYNRQLQDENQALIDLTTSGMAGVVADYSNLIKSAANSSTAKKPADKLVENNQAVQAQYNNAISALASIYGGSGLNQSYLDTYRKQLDDIYGKYYRG